MEITSQPSLVNANWVMRSLEERTLLNIEDFRPISSFENIINSDQMRKEVIHNTNLISHIFQGQTFYIYKESYSEEELHNIEENIKENAGEILEPNVYLSRGKELPNAKFIIVNDGYTESLTKSNRRCFYTIIINGLFLIDMYFSVSKKKKLIELKSEESEGVCSFSTFYVSCSLP